MTNNSVNPARSTGTALVRRWWMHHAALDVLAGAHIGATIAGVAGRALFEPVDAVETVVTEERQA